MDGLAYSQLGVTVGLLSMDVVGLPAARFEVLPISYAMVASLPMSQAGSRVYEGDVSIAKSEVRSVLRDRPDVSKMVLLPVFDVHVLEGREVVLPAGGSSVLNGSVEGLAGTGISNLWQCARPNVSSLVMLQMNSSSVERSVAVGFSDLWQSFHLNVSRMMV
ncbi:hypothetical protein NE237_004263 [Protea cynaroides]|uniref:Uncharacterized protein n=1 Tax=Protea cynaroides TaxID=273540 RepID=A0A9Q0KIL0_9MAGN|nr:hypothetical protein NE237_004263 [Protea cynaroides]